MANVFGIDSSVVSTSGSRFQEFSEDYRTYMNELRTSIEALANVWKGEDYKKFKEIYERNSEVIEQMSKAFADMGNVFTDVAKQSDAAGERAQASYNRNV